MRNSICLVALWSTMARLAADPIQLWPNGAPGEREAIGPEKDTTTAKDGLIAGKRVIRLGNVTKPEITLYRPVNEKDTGAAVLVFPGGGYSILAMDLEGTEVCEWLQSIGITGVLLKYRVPARAGQPKWAAPLQDAQRALGMVRYHAAEWGIDGTRIGVLGFSAGGHLAAMISTNFERRTYAPIDDADKVSCRPDFALLIYPAYLVVKEDGDKVSPELKVNGDTPRSFLVQAEDDGVRVENSLGYYAALKRSKVPVEMHLYPEGGHGYGLRRTEKTVTTWPDQAEAWLRATGAMAKK
jgi:acetyl esterase/lipase